eukprot:1147864-Pelagomonas_calceolata.AAC.6
MVRKAVYDMAKARAEHSEMAGRVTKAKAEATNMAQRLAAAHLALAEVVHVIHLSDDVTSGVQVRMSAAYVQALRAAEVVGSPCEPPVKFGP